MKKNKETHTKSNHKGLLRKKRLEDLASKLLSNIKKRKKKLILKEKKNHPYLITFNISGKKKKLQYFIVS